MVMALSRRYSEGLPQNRNHPIFIIHSDRLLLGTILVLFLIDGARR
jgi:hypothetical protein